MTIDFEARLIFNKAFHSSCIQMGNVVDASTFRAFDVRMFTRLGIVAEAVLPCVEHLDNTKLAEDFYRFINCSKTHRRILFLDLLVNHFCGRMLRRMGKHVIHSQSLRRDLAPIIPKDLGKFGGSINNQSSPVKNIVCALSSKRCAHH